MSVGLFIAKKAKKKSYLFENEFTNKGKYKHYNNKVSNVKDISYLYENEYAVSKK